MRIELTIPDSTRPDLVARIVAITERLSRQPEFATEIELETSEEAEAIRLTSEQIAFIRKGQAEIEEGKFLTSEQVKADLAAHRTEWLRANPR
jgi:predicted transcriptional regulator